MTSSIRLSPGCAEPRVRAMGEWVGNDDSPRGVPREFSPRAMPMAGPRAGAPDSRGRARRTGPADPDRARLAPDDPLPRGRPGLGSLGVGRAGSAWPPLPRGRPGLPRPAGPVGVGRPAPPWTARSPVDGAPSMDGRRLGSAGAVVGEVRPASMDGGRM